MAGRKKCPNESEVFFEVCKDCKKRKGCTLALHWWFEGVRFLDRCDFKEKKVDSDGAI